MSDQQVSPYAATVWHPTITLAMVQQYDPSIQSLTGLIVQPDGWTSLLADGVTFSPGPPTGTGLAHP